MIEPDTICIKSYYENGNIQHIRWYLPGTNIWHTDILHNTNGPSRISYYENGNINVECWRQNDKFHRIDGPAFTFYNTDGTILIKEWWENGVQIDKPE